MKTRTCCKFTQLDSLLACQSAIMDIEAVLSIPKNRRVRLSHKTKGQLRKIERCAGMIFSKSKSSH